MLIMEKNSRRIVGLKSTLSESFAMKDLRLIKNMLKMHIARER